MKIHILGASGSGTTTLGKALSNKLNIKFFDSDDYFWINTDPPFQKQREKDNRTELLKADLEKCDSWILSGSSMGWGDFIIDELDYVIYIYLDPSIRIERLKQREIERYGNRINQGNDLYETHIAFIEWAKKYDFGGLEIRSKESHKVWMQKIKCPIIRINNVMSFEKEVEYCMEVIK
jgi:Adenylate kinase and related kinases